MSGKRNCCNYAMAAKFFKSLESELAWRTTISTRGE